MTTVPPNSSQDSVPTSDLSAMATPYNRAGCFADPNLASISRRCQTFGLKSFVLAAETAAGEFSFHYEKITMDTVMKMMLAGVLQAAEIDGRRHPERSETYRQAMAGFVVDIGEAVKKLNRKTSLL